LNFFLFLAVFWGVFCDLFYIHLEYFFSFGIINLKKEDKLMEKTKNKKNSKRINLIPYNRKILLFRHGIRFYPYLQKRKILPACS